MQHSLHTLLPYGERWEQDMHQSPNCREHRPSAFVRNRERNPKHRDHHRHPRVDPPERTDHCSATGATPDRGGYPPEKARSATEAERTRGHHFVTRLPTPGQNSRPEPEEMPPPIDSSTL